MKLYGALLGAFLCAVSFLQAEAPVLAYDTIKGEVITDGSKRYELPKHFRDVELAKTYRAQKPFNKNGLENLHALAGAEFSEQELRGLEQYTADKHPGRTLVIVDLRAESHGFLDGDSFSWFVLDNIFNFGKTREEIDGFEKKAFAGLNEDKSADVFFLREVSQTQGDGEWFDVVDEPTKRKVCFASARSEEALVRSHGIAYMRLPWTDRHAITTQQLMSLLAFFRSLEDQQMLYVHCKAGRGRTSLFLVLYDIYKNSHEVSLHDILMRHHLLGGSNLMSTDLKSGNNRYRKERQERLRLVRDFYSAVIQRCKLSQGDCTDAGSRGVGCGRA